jgi:archaellum component FlaG (FlaF/FlaG flagellin family)
MNKKVLLGGALSLVAVGLIACGNNDSTKKKEENNSNKFTLLNEDDAFVNDMDGTDDAYTLYSNNSGNATYKFKVGKNISLKLSNTKYATINKVSTGRYNVDMHVANKDDESKSVVLTVYKNSKKYKNLGLEVDNHTDSFVAKENAKEEAKKQQEAKDKQAKLDAEYPDFTSKFPNGTASLDENDDSLVGMPMKFTGKVYGLGATGIKAYDVLLKDAQGNLVYAVIDNEMSGKLVEDQIVTIYGASNGVGNVRDRDVDLLAIDANDLGKNMLLFNVDKIQKGRVDIEPDVYK